MARAGVPNHFRVEIRIEIGCCDKVIFEFSAQSFVQPGKHARRVIGVAGLAGKRDFKHRSNQGGGDAVSGDVGDENAKMISFERQEIVEISRNGAHGKITRCDFDPGAASNFARKNGCLNLLRDFQLFLNSKEALFLGNNSMGHKIAEGAHQKEKADRFDVSPWKNMKTREVCTENENAENAQAQGDNAELGREAARWPEEKQEYD